MGTIDKALTQKVVEANIKYFADTAKTYDTFHACTKLATQERYSQEITALLGRLQTGSTAPLVLDAATGTGSLAFLFAKRGCRVVGVDVSAPMLDLLRRKLGEYEAVIRLVEGEVVTFLATEPAEFDVIAFGSALHHFADYIQVIGLSAQRLRPGGAIYVGLEPSNLSSTMLLRFDRWLCRADDLLAMLLRQPRSLFAKLWARLFCRRTKTAPNIGSLAEFHVDTGVDKMAILAELRRLGLSDITVRERFGGKYALIRWLKRQLVREPDEFSLWAYKSARAPGS